MGMGHKNDYIFHPTFLPVFEVVFQVLKRVFGYQSDLILYYKRT